MSIPEAIAAARDRIDRATSACGRTDSVTLELAVKTRTPEECRTAAAQAVTIVGIPLAIANLKMIPITCFPFGKVVIDDPTASIL